MSKYFYKRNFMQNVPVFQWCHYDKPTRSVWLYTQWEQNTSFFSLRFLRWWASASCEEADSSLEYSRIRLSMAPFTIWSRRFVSSSRTSSSSSSLGSSPVWVACIEEIRISDMSDHYHFLQTPLNRENPWTTLDWHDP